jgi:predicted ATPase/DNA-binding SARP family transcriptional activator
VELKRGFAPGADDSREAIVGQHAETLSDAHPGGTAQLAIWLLGGFRVTFSGRVIDEDGWRLRKSRGVVKLLALAPNHRLLRERVVDLLWPESDPEAAASSFHRALYVARRALEQAGANASSALHLQNDVLSLSPRIPCWVDVDAFEAASAEARRGQEPAAYRTALDLYAGDLLPEDRYEDWAQPRRDALRQLYLALVADLAQLYEDHGEHAAAITTLQQLLGQDPAQEETHRRLMRLYALTGRRQQALRQFQALEEALRRDIGAGPDAESQRLREDILEGRFSLGASAVQIQRQAGAPPGPGAPAVTSQAMQSPGQHAPSHNLLLQLTSFVGREREMAELTSLLATTRLLTLTGVGGCGKTRLAVEMASSLLDTFDDGVWLVELAALTDPTLVPQAVASILGVSEQPGRPVTESLAGYLKARRLLLVLDNCEHLIVACAQLVEALLRTCPNLGVLATSREPLHIAGELTWRVPSLSLPDPRRLPSLADLAQNEAVRLFVERTRAVLPSYTLTAQNARAVAQVCYRLDGIPLAIELAAARVNMLPVEQIVVRLDDCFGLLTGGSRTSLTRQQTLRATLDWSYDLLSERERDLFAWLAAFAGGFSLEAAESVCASDDGAPSAVLERLTQLVDKSLVVAEEQSGAARYRLLEPIRQYAQERLHALGQLAPVQRRHASWFLGVAERAESELSSPDQAAWLNRLEMEHDNLRAALSWCLRGEPEMGLRLARALWQFWLGRGHFAEGRKWLHDQLARAPSQSALRPQALLGACALAVRQGDFTGAVHLIEESLAISRALGDKLECARALHDLGSLTGVLANHARAQAPFEESLALVRETGFAPGTASVTHSMGILAWYEGDFVQAKNRLEESVALFREAVDAPGLSFPMLNLGWIAVPPARLALPRMALWEETFMLFRQVTARSAVGYALANLGNLARLDGDYPQARVRLEESLALFRTLRDRPALAQVRGQLGILATAEGDFAQAQALLEESLGLRRELGDRRGVAVTLGNLGNLAVAAGDHGRARAVMEESLDLVRAMGDKPGTGGILSNLGYAATCAGDYARARELLEESQAQMQEAELPREVALQLYNRGVVARLQGDDAAARGYFELGLARFRELGARRGSALMLHELGRLARGEGNEVQARTLIGQSLALYRELGDPGATATLRQEVLDLGGRPDPKSEANPAGARRLRRESRID